MGSRNNKPGRIVKGTALQPSLKSASGVWSLDEAMQAHRANAWPQPNLFQPVANSLRLDGNKQTFLSKAISRSGNRKTWTFSTWIKGDLANGFNNFFTSNIYTSISDSLSIRVYGGQWAFEIFNNNSYGAYQLRVTQLFRDPSAWYHLVVAVDTTQATASNRIKMYVNGQQITAFNTANYPVQNYDTPVNSNSWAAGIGSWSDGASGLNGYMTEVNFIDGHALYPSLLGKLDTNNTWVPVPYTGSYGTNGFYLPFTNATTSQTLGYDASLTGTTTYDADQDPYRGSVALHLTGNGPAGANNNVFADSSPNNLAITRNGDATQGSFSPFPMPANAPYNPAIHGASACFDGTGDYLSTPASTPVNFGSGDFTMECWFYSQTSSKEQVLMGMWASDGAGIGISLHGGGGANINNVRILSGNGTWTLSTSANNIYSLNSWNHVALVRSGNTWTAYMNGVSATTITYSSAAYYNASIPFTITRAWSGAGATYDFQGYISNVRVTKGAAIYTAAFTPTNRPFGTLTNNLLTFSEDFANSVWTGQSAVVGLTTNAAIAPDGTPSATLLVPSTSSAGQNIAGLHDSAAGVNTFSIYAKSAGYRYMQCFHSRSAGGDAGYVTFDLTTGAVTNSSVWSGSIVDVGNGWYRIIATTSSLAGASANSNVRWAITDGTASRAPVFTGDGTSGIYVWGAQAELASSAGNYTPTPANFSTAPSLLLNFANAAVVDATGAQNLIASGSPTITSSAKYGSGAMTFNGSGDYWITPATPSLAFGTDNFTIEGWINNFALNNMPVLSIGTYVTGIDIRFNESGSNQFGLYINSVWVYGTFTTTNQWRHFAITRQNTTVRIFIDGQQIATTSNNTNLTGNYAWIGKFTAGGVGGNTSFYGSMDDIRITKGVARYQSDFAPPARALPEVGGKSFVTTNVNAGVAQRFVTVGTTAWTAPTDVTSVEVLVVGGGGAGGRGTGGGGGGGGAGGLIYNSAYPVTPGQTYTVSVGAGATGITTSTPGSSGANSIFGNLTAIGGGGGGGNGSGAYHAGLVGGSGGGAGDSSNDSVGAVGTAGQGFNGGASALGSPDYGAGGGGGAGGAGGNGSVSSTGNGGVGLQFGISGTPTYYAGGGGGGAGYANASGNGPVGTGGAGGGGTGGYNGSVALVNATANTGGGGGGVNNIGNGGLASGNGGSGVVIVRYTTTAVGNTSDATSDNLVDSPTQYGHDYGNGGEVVGNYCTLNPIDTETDHSFSNGNLTLFKAAGNWSSVRSTMAFSSGKWYFETTYNASWDYAHMGVLDVTVDTYAGQVANSGYVGNYAKGWAYQQDARIYNNNTILSGSGVQVSLAGDIAMCAVDMDNGKIWWGKNGTWFNSGNPAAGTNAAYSNLSGTVSPAFSVYGNSSGITVNFGQRAWAYAPPAGFNALTTKNLPRPAVGSAAAAPNEYFDAVTWTGTGAAQTITLPGAFQPDLVWTKSRSFENNHHLFDSVRGSTVSLKSNTTAAEDVRNTTLQAFNSNGFSLGSAADVNGSGSTYVAWCWRAGGAAVSNTSGTLTSQVSANTASGFSVVTYTGTATSGATVGHGLSAAPELIITKARNQTLAWYTYTTVIDGSMDYFLLNTNAAKGDSGLTVPTSTVFYNDGWSASYNMLAYCFHSVAGYSKIGTYTSNGSADGTFVYTGFRPAFIMIKRYDSGSTADWQFIDTTRDVVNASGLLLQPNANYTESNATPVLDFLSNGFKNRNTYNVTHASGGTYIYMAFADKPFGNVNGTAR